MTTTAVERISAYDVEKVREDFPILREQIHGKPLVYLDNAATTQKPLQVLDAIRSYYEHDNSNVHRGVHALSERATNAYESARGDLQRFLNAASEKEIIFTRGCTEAINLVASTFGRANVGAGDEIIISAIEHHSNIVPWQMLCAEKGARLRIIPINDEGELLIDEYEQLFNDRTRLVAVGHVSNALGTVNPIRRMGDIAHGHDVPILIDGAQGVPHLPIDVQALGCDFYALSAHKVYGPTGIGALWGRRELLEKMPPWQGGGDMILSVTFEKTTYNALPYKFEAGTPNIEGAVGFGAALRYVEKIGRERIAAHEHDLLVYATEQLTAIPELTVIGRAREKASVLSFVLEGVHPHDIGTIVDEEGVAIRTGHHCAQPVMLRFGIPATARASFGLYNTREEVDVLVRAVYKVLEVFG